jgi:predicted NAD/FAD-binding protein
MTLGPTMIQAVDVAVVGEGWSGIGCTVALTKCGFSSRAARTEADARWCIMIAMSNTDTANFPPFDCAHVSSDDGSFPLDWISVDPRKP